MASVSMGGVAPAPPVANLASNRVVRVVDGDTVVLRRGGEDITCRLIGVDTPETVAPGKPVQPGGREATEYLRGWIGGKVVRVSYQTSPYSRDRYGRPLVYLWADMGRQSVNYEMIRRGMGKFTPSYPTMYRAEFKAAETEARMARRGIWGAGP